MARILFLVAHLQGQQIQPLADGRAHVNVAGHEQARPGVQVDLAALDLLVGDDGWAVGCSEATDDGSDLSQGQ